MAAKKRTDREVHEAYLIRKVEEIHQLKIDAAKTATAKPKPGAA